MQRDIGIYLFSRLTITSKVGNFFRALSLPLSPLLLSIWFFRDGALHVSSQCKNYFSVYAASNSPEPIAFIPIAVRTSGRLYPDFFLLLFFHAHREASALANEIPEESDRLGFICAARFANLKGSGGLTLAKASALRVSVPIDLSSRPFPHAVSSGDPCPPL
jgi:hypothetical protein